MRLDRDTFGPVLRAARERRGISLRQLAASTKVSVDLWAALEDNDFSRWPERIYARTYVRAYATHIGFDPDVIVNEFCRLFPEQGDRRVESLLRAHAAIVQHELDWRDEAVTPEQRDRRASDRAPSAQARFLARYATRLIAVALDVAVPLALALPAVALHAGFWPSLAVSALVYHAVGVLASGRTAGTALVDRFAKSLGPIAGARSPMSTRVETS
jgi:transcriptional regulator with XRE-family HTH domain